jgi:CheY-like chemotaxis protein
LRKYGFDATITGTVPEALKEVESRQFDLLLCDLNIHWAGDGFL